MLVLKTLATLTELRCRGPQAQLREIPEEVMQFVPEVPLQLNMKIFAFCIRSAPAGSAPGSGGCTNEMLKVCLDDAETFQLLGLAAADFARSRVPPNAMHCFTMETLTEERRRSARDSHRHHIPKTAGQMRREAVQQGC